MDSINWPDAQKQGSRQNPATGLGQWSSRSSQPTFPMPLFSNNPGTTWNTAGMGARFNPCFSSGQHGSGNVPGASSSGFSFAGPTQFTPNQNSNAHKQGYGADSIGTTHTNYKPSQGSNAHQPQVDVGETENSFYSTKNKFLQPLLPTPLLPGSTQPNECSNTQPSGNNFKSSQSLNSRRSQVGMGDTENSLYLTKNKFLQPLLPTPLLPGPTQPNECSNTRPPGTSFDWSRVGKRRDRRKNPPSSTIQFSHPQDTFQGRREHPSSDGGSRAVHDSVRWDEYAGGSPPMGIGGRYSSDSYTPKFIAESCSAPSSSRFESRYPEPENSRYNHNHPSENQVIPDNSHFGENRLIFDARNLSENLPVPDGTSNLKYPPPDVKNLVFDSSTGYRFDPTTGLHYDANSGFYINNQLKVLLRWDTRTSTYMLVSNTLSGLAAPAAILNKTQGSSLTAGISPENLKALARELAPLLKTETQEPDPRAKFDPRRSPEPINYLRQDRQPSISTDDYRDYENPGRGGVTDFNPRRTPENLPPADDAFLWHRRYRETSKNHRSPSPVEHFRRRADDRYDDLRDRLRHERRGSISPDRKWNERRDLGSADHTRDERRESVRAVRRWSDGRDGLSLSENRSCSRGSRSPRRSPNRDPGLAIAKIHEYNLKSLHNVYGRYFPKDPKPSCHLLVAPVPPPDVMRRQEVTKYLEDLLSSDRLTFRNVRVFQGGFGAPCDHAIIQFDNKDDATYWYQLYRGTIGIGNSISRYSAFLFFSENHWICSKRSLKDKGCNTPTPNFPHRTLCYKCLELRSKLQSPIVMKESPTKWIGILELDCTKYTSVTDVLKLLPPHKGVTIESTEFLREPNGLPIGVCVFQILNREESIRFFDILKNKGLKVSYLNLDKKGLDSTLDVSNRREQGGRETEYSQPPPTNARVQSEGMMPKKRNRPNSERRKKQKLDKLVIEEFEAEFVVVDECQGAENDYEIEKSSLKTKATTSNQGKRLLTASTLKNVVSVHTKISQDPDNLLSKLFVDPTTVKVALLLAPIPEGDRDLVKKEIERILKTDDVEFTSVQVFHGNALGAPCRYGLVRFSKPCGALSWYSKNEGLIYLSDGANDRMKTFMFFSDNNWICLECQFSNFPLRTWCIRCFKNRGLSATIRESRTPTKFLGISPIGLPFDMSESVFSPDVILSEIPEEHSKCLVDCKMMLEDKGLPGVFVIETEDSKKCEHLRRFLLSKGWSPSFLKMPSDSGEAPDSDYNATEAQPEQNSAVLVNETVLKYDLMKHIYDNSKPSQFIILSPAPALNRSSVKEQFEKMLAKNCSYEICQPKAYGSPQEYIQVRFTDVQNAENWYEKVKGFLELPLPGNRKFRMILYYSDDAWRCRACTAINFPARSLCNKCYAHRDENGFTPVTMSVTPTRWVGISHLREVIYNLGQVKNGLPPLDSFAITCMRFIKEPNPLLPVRLCVIETPTTRDGQDLAAYLQKHPDMKFGNERGIKIIYVNLNQPPGKKSCEDELDTTQSDSSLSLLNYDDPFFPDDFNDLTDNFNLYWGNLHRGIEQGEDVLKKYFRDQYTMPLPLGNSVFLALPSIQRKVGSPVTLQFRKVLESILQKSGASVKVAESSKLYKDRATGAPCNYSIIRFENASSAESWCNKHNGKLLIALADGTRWTSYARVSNSNWNCRKCAAHNFPLRVYCYCCYESRGGGAPAVTLSDSPSRFVGITKFQNWCATKDILFENIKSLRQMNDDQRLREVHYPTEPSGLSLGLCVLEFVNISVARNVFSQLIASTPKRHTIVYLESY